MKILSCRVENFGSYKDLEFSFDKQGLTLIAGPTGSGKSTLCDVIPWILFGRTAKDGAVDEIRAWPGDKVTKGTVYFEHGLEVTRIRGSAKDNDLFFCYENDTGTVSAERGKDLNDTQKLLNGLLGLNLDLYLAGAYFHEFSQTAQFFTASAKSRRQITEQLVDLNLAKTLQEHITTAKREVKPLIEEFERTISNLESNIQVLEKMQETEANKEKQWEKDHIKTYRYIEGLYTRFEFSRIRTISSVCHACQTVLEEPKTIKDKSKNPYRERLVEVAAEENPHTGSVKDFSAEIKDRLTQIKVLQDTISIKKQKDSDLELLSRVVQDFRAILVKNTIVDLENNTNNLLNDHFDAEIRVQFDIQEADKLETTIYKDGNLAAYTQLSKGQRQLLKLSFGLSVMKCVQNHHGIHFNAVFLDEFADGLDESLKVKAYGLLQQLATEHESVFAIDHSEGLKAMFENRYDVELINGSSQIAST